MLSVVSTLSTQLSSSRYLEDMLHFWSSDTDTDDSSEYSSYDDNPEDNNLFDRLERKW